MRTPQVLHALLVRDFMTAYGRSPLGVLWAVAEPAIGIALLTIVFSQISSVPPMGSSYPLFYATGYLPFLLFTSIQARVMGAPRQGKSVLSHAPVTIADVLISRTLLQTLIMAAVLAIVYGGVWLIYAPPERMDFTLMAFAFLLTTALASGIGVLNAGIVEIFKPWGKVWGVAMRPLFLISGVFYAFAIMPPSLQNILWWNPVLHVVGMNREAVYQGYEGSYISPLYVGIVALITWIIGLSLLLNRKR